MGKIIRDPEAATKQTYDLIIIGGGIYGLMLSFEASRRGLRSLLLEKSDFGGATTFNCLRILHGGFRYLQKMDLHRFRESVAERRWFLQSFPDLVKPLPCLMPLYGNGLRRPSILRIATWINDTLSYNRNKKVKLDNYLPASEIINVSRTRKTFPQVDLKGLKGGAIWYDAYMPDSQLIVMEILRLACEDNAVALNYVEACELRKSKTGVAGLVAVDLEKGELHEFRSNVVVNAAGPWCREIAARFYRDEPELFRASIAWNLIFDRDSISSYALAVTPKKLNARTYFLLPWKGKILAGTGHAPWNESIDHPVPTYKMIQNFLDELNLAVPSLCLKAEDILHVFSGLLPVTRNGSADLTVREMILNHADRGGPAGLYSISGIKFTTARRVAERTLNLIFPKKKIIVNTMDDIFTCRQNQQKKWYNKIYDFDWIPEIGNGNWKMEIRKIAEEESVQHIDDLIFRRTNLWDNPVRANKIAPYLHELFNWNESRCRNEITRLNQRFRLGFWSGEFSENQLSEPPG